MFKLSIHLSLHLIRDNKQNNTESKNTVVAHDFQEETIATILSLEGVRSRSTIGNYQTAMRSFCQYVGSNFTLESIDASLIEGYQQWLQQNNVTQNTISCYMRSLRSLLHHVSPSLKKLSLFDHVFTGRQHTDKRSIPLADIIRLQQLQLPCQSAIAFSRDIFLFSFYALGMPFVDIAFLQKRQVKDGYIIYHRHKTGQRIRVKIEPPMQQIIQRYAHNNSPYVFPILPVHNHIRQATDYESARTRYNRHLKKLGTMAGIPHKLTSYVARHSWASIAYHSNVDLSVISKALGHTSPHTTLTYIREIDDNRIDTANHQLLQNMLHEVY